MALERIEAIPQLAPRPRESHKGRFGTVLVVAGSRGMAGAAALCGAAALRSGAGLVRIATAAEVQPVVAGFEPSYMTYPLACTADGLIDFPKARPVLQRLLAPATVVAVGPGLGQSEEIHGLLRFLLAETDKPLILDADGLNALVGQTELLAGVARPVILTPHPGEFARLTGTGVTEIQADRPGQAAQLATTSPALVVVLKGAGTIVTDGRRYFENSTGNPGMATGGTGDVLTGVIAALLAQGLPAFEAAQLGVFVHGLAGDIARDNHGELGLIAGDLVDALPDAFTHLMPDPDIIT
ncbi:MAG TPA: NAD(P)H-hydrate dehydratase [Isosphaeraceae bacterium]|nr:NAD(P)H-hydrate dehydratase [Isosphaeraceae bacterium]